MSPVVRAAFLIPQIKQIRDTNDGQLDPPNHAVACLVYRTFLAMCKEMSKRLVIETIDNILLIPRPLHRSRNPPRQTTWVR